MDLEIKDKIAFVTGASGGIGAATAKILAEEGSHVILSYHKDLKGVEQTAEHIRSLGQQAWTVQIDLADTESVQAASEKIKLTNDQIDLMILCAGQNIITPMQEVTPEEWERVLKVNLNGPYFMIQSLLPLLKSGATIVTVASVAAHTGAPHHIHYAAAKAGLINLTKSLARGLAPDIRVNCVAPGVTETTMGKETIASLPADYAERKLLVRQFASPEEIARCIVFVASPLARFITGTTIDINGGRYLR
jgi:3-oxoacyl-[acyl-carrier protein] reductase